ncbi:glutamate receptor 2.8-like [Argentina anserina]|uniref:glutamate receptor 2.8-like n=1 Tax=Argentina anserina TaxID=57926 RepID=UPI0021767D90|nr:glutamate receptor 2.8-like [Potentilla anserina]
MHFKKEVCLDLELSLNLKFRRLTMINKKHPSHLNKRALFSIFVIFLSLSISMAKPQNKSPTLVNLGVVLHDLNHSVGGKMWLSCIEMALSDFYASRPHYNTRLVLKFREYKPNSVLGAANAALDLIKNDQVQAIIGPVTSMETSFVISLGDQAQVPIISFSATSPSLTSLQSSYFFQFAQNDAAQVKAISAIIKTFGWRQVVPIYADTVYDDGMIPILTDALQEVDARVPYRSVISPSATDDQIKSELYKLMTMQTRVFIVHVTSDLCSKLFAKAEEVGMMGKGYVWLITSGITNRLSSMNSSVISTMNGVVGVQTYVQKTTELEDVKFRWKRHFRKHYQDVDAELDVFGLWAYDATFAIAMATEQVLGTTSSIGFQDPNASNNLTGLDTLPASSYGPKLREALSTTEFKGIASDFSVVDGQLQSSNYYSIVNVDGRGARSIGFWTPQHGLVRRLNPESFEGNIGPIIWPGDSVDAPTGWVNPTGGKRLRVGIPVKNRYDEFVNVMKDPVTNQISVSGFSVDVFKAAVESLPYALPYEYIPFANPDGTSAGSYSDLCYQVYLGKFDAAVGDITVTKNRSKYVDFTTPYIDSGVAMVVPVLRRRSENAWVFLRPWTWDLWLTTSCFFLFIGFVVWVLEHRINEDFRGPPSHQVSTGLWFSFSTMVFAHTAKVVSNLGRFVMAVWIFVVLVLTINYTANLTSLYTVQKLKPTPTGLKDLLSEGENVGYTTNPNVYQYLKQVGFKDSKLRHYRNLEEIAEALLKGSANGGVAALVDETPYSMLIASKYCDKYTMIGPLFKTDGFAFAFPKKSPILPDISLVILDMIRGQKMSSIQSIWIKNNSNCQRSSAEKEFRSSIDTDNFWVLFLIAGTASTLALIIFVASFIYRHRYIFTQPDPDGSCPSTWTKIQTMFTVFNEKDPNYHAFKCSQPPSAIESSPSHPHSPEDDRSSHTDTDFAFSGEQHTSATDQASPENAPAAPDVVVALQIITPSTA